MRLWYRIEQAFKRRFLRILEWILPKKPVLPQFVPFGKFRRILVVRQHDQLGDFLLSTPVLRALRENFPQAHIGVVVRSYFADVLKNHPFADEVLVMHEDLRKWTLSKIWRFYRQLRSGWDLAIVLNTVSHSVTSDFIAYFSGADYILGSEHRVFPGCKRNFFYNLVAPYFDGLRHQSERNLDIVRYIDVDTADLSEVMHLTEEELADARIRMQQNGVKSDRPVIGMHVGAGKVANRWPVEKFVRLAETLHADYGCQILLFWGPKEEDLKDEFLAQANFRPILMPPMSLRQVAAAFTQCHALVCNDTGVMHLAAANRVPLVAIFGPTDPAEWKPLGDPYIALRGDAHKTENVTVDAVLAALRELLPDRLVPIKAPAAESPSAKIADTDASFDISEHVIEDYVNSLQRLEKLANRKKGGSE